MGLVQVSWFQGEQYSLVSAIGRADGAATAGAGRVGVRGRGGRRQMLATAQPAPVGILKVILFRISRLHNTCNLI